MFEGRYINLEPLHPAMHADSIWEATSGAANDHLWDWMPYGPFSRADFDAFMARSAASPDPLFYAVHDQALGRATGHCTLMRIDAPNRVIEVGGIMFSPLLQRTRGATEAMYLMARHVFEDRGYRRYEWKCNNLNLPSKKAAVRLGFTFEGIFRQHMIVKGKNRDTAWYSMLDSEWPERKARFERWLEPGNFDEQGQQKSPLNPALKPA